MGGSNRGYVGSIIFHGFDDRRPRCRWRFSTGPAKRGGRRREVNVREVLNAIFYVLSTGCQWQALPKDLPPKSTAHHYFGLWDWDGTLERVHHALYVQTRERAGREASPSAAIIDSQSGKAAQKGALRSTPKALMRARKSPAASATFWSIRWASC